MGARQAKRLAGEAGTVEGEAVEGAEDGNGDAFGLEEVAGEGLHFVAGDGFDRGENFVEGIEALEIELPGAPDWTSANWWIPARASGNL